MPATAEEAVCARCGGRGWVVEADGGAGSARPCSCRDETRSARLLAAAGIPERYRGCKLDNFQVNLQGSKPQLVRALTVARRYADAFLTESGGFRETGLLFVGPPGVGKTHLATAVLVELVRRYRVRGRFADFTSLIHQIQATFDPLPFDVAAARAYGQIYAAVRSAGRKARGRRFADLLIAATALGAGLPLYTRNPDDFVGLGGLVEVVHVEAAPDS